MQLLVNACYPLRNQIVSSYMGGKPHNSTLSLYRAFDGPLRLSIWIVSISTILPDNCDITSFGHMVASQKICDNSVWFSSVYYYYVYYYFYQIENGWCEPYNNIQQALQLQTQIHHRQMKSRQSATQPIQYLMFNYNNRVQSTSIFNQNIMKLKLVKRQSVRIQRKLMECFALILHDLSKTEKGNSIHGPVLKEIGCF